MEVVKSAHLNDVGRGLMGQEPDTTVPGSDCPGPDVSVWPAGDSGFRVEMSLMLSRRSDRVTPGL
jgi:hypothetical protein